MPKLNAKGKKAVGAAVAVVLVAAGVPYLAPLAPVVGDLVNAILSLF